MFKNYLKIAFRSLKRNKGYTFINITGLTVGIAATLLIFVIVRFQLSFDTFHTKKDRIYRVVSVMKSPDNNIDYSSGVPIPTAQGLRIDYPQLEKVAAVYEQRNNLISIATNSGESKKFKERQGVFFAEASFFGIFDFPMLAGDAATALASPNTAIITQETAEKYFGDWQSAMGRSFKLDNKEMIKVTGILKNVPVNSDFPFKVVMSYATAKESKSTDWISIYSQAYCFTLLPANTSAAQVNSWLTAFVKKHKPAENVNEGMQLQPLHEMHFDDRFGNYRGRVFSKTLLTSLSLIGIFILLIACINFINLATAQAINRSKEVGVRKTLGSSRTQLIAQFIGETALISFVAVMMAAIIARLTLPLLNNLLTMQATMGWQQAQAIALFLLLILVAVTLLSGFYPALVLSGFNPITALKNKVISKAGSGISLRRTLVVVQFTMAQVLVIGTLIVISQMSYLRQASLGFTKEAIVTVPIPTDSTSRLKIDALRNDFLQTPGVKNVSFNFSSPASGSRWGSDFVFDNSAKLTPFESNLKWADADFLKTFDIPLIAGRNYYPSDTVHEFVVNETLVKKLGIRNPNDIIGKKISFWDNELTGNVVGVVKDFHTTSLHEPIDVVVMSTWKAQYRQVNIRLAPGQVKPTLAAIEKIWNKTYPEYVYEHNFLDEQIDRFYRQEDQLSSLYKLFAGIAIVISCLGLYGLVSFMAVQRTKEVGIRKVLGASATNIVYLFSREFTLLIVIAFCIAGPVAYFIMHEWLQDFTFRISPGIGVFALAIAGSIIIAWLTVGYKAISAALAKPVKSLRTE